MLFEKQIQDILNTPKAEQVKKESLNNILNYGKNVLHTPSLETGKSIEEVNGKVDNLEIEKQIEAIKDENMPSHITTSMGKKSWNFDQQKRINELENRKK